jgi:arylsulfatase
VVCALGDWNGGYALYAVDGRPVFAFARAHDTLRVAGTEPLPPGPHRLAVTMTPTAGGGLLELACDGSGLASLSFEGGFPLALQHGGAALSLGRDRGFPVCDDYRPPAPWTGAIERVRVETPAAGLAPDAAGAGPEVERALRAD